MVVDRESAPDPEKLIRKINEKEALGWKLITITSIAHPITTEKHYAWFRRQAVKND